MPLPQPPPIVLGNWGESINEGEKVRRINRKIVQVLIAATSAILSVILMCLVSAPGRFFFAFIAILSGALAFLIASEIRNE